MLRQSLLRFSVALLTSAMLAAGCHRAPMVAMPVLSPTARVLRFGTLLDGTGRVVTDAVVIVDGGRIVSVASGAAAIPRGAAVADLRAFAAMPGLIDVHTHMTYVGRPPAPGTAAPVPGAGGRGPSRTPEQTFALEADNARRTLETGVTTVRDLGAQGYADIALRDSINKGVVPGPRMFVAGYGLQKARPQRAGGAGAAPAPPNAPPPAMRGRITMIADIPVAVKAQVDAGADYIKMYGSTGTGADTTGVETFSFDEMKAAVDAAHALGRRIAIHSYGPAGGRDALLAGANSVEHPVGMDDATIAEFVKRGTYYVPTIDHNRFYSDNAALRRYTTEQAAALDTFVTHNLETARRAFRAGVKMAMGSDAVDWMFGENTRELGWLVKAGMTPAQAIAAATTGGADLIGVGDKVGKVAPGYYADMVAVEGNPLVDINVVINNVRWVMKNGVVVVDRRRP